MLHAVASKLLGALALAAAIMAVGLPITAAGALVIYATALAASLLTIIPGGIGTVEASTTALLIGAGATAGAAALAVALFRLFDLWLPVLTGAAVARRDARRERRAPEAPRWPCPTPSISPASSTGRRRPHTSEPRRQAPPAALLACRVVVAAGNAGPPRPRLAELVAALSLGIDLGFGQPMEHVLRQCIIALRLAERTGLDDDERLVVYYTALLVNVGCHSDAHEQAKWFGDDIALKADKYRYELRGVRSAAHGMRRLGSGSPPLHRFRLGLEFALKGYRDLDGMIERHAALAADLAGHIGVPEAVQQALAASYEMWDGKGWPGKLGGSDIPIAARLSQFAEFMEVAHRVSGVEGATTLARSWSGKQFDPGLAAAFCADAGEMLCDLDTTSTWAMVVDNEPSLGVHLSEDEFDQALDSIAAFVDLKSPYFLGHSRGVAELVAEAGTTMGLDADDVRTLRRAGLAHGFGRLGISNSIWDKPGPLGAGERERVRMHPYLNERILQQSPALAPLAAITVQFRERLDGSRVPPAIDGRCDFERGARARRR